MTILQGIMILSVFFFFLVRFLQYDTPTCHKDTLVNFYTNRRSAEMFLHNVWRMGGAIVGMLLFFPLGSWGGGAWVPKPGDGYIQMGFSRKTADRVWDAKGGELIIKNASGDTHYHDFRYGYLTGEVGVFKNVSTTFVFTYLWGFEGYRLTHLEKNFGFSDAWIGAKYQIKEGDWPMALRMTMRTPFLYNQPGPYTRHLHHDGSYRLPGGGSVVPDTTFFVMSHPEWRGLNKKDLTLAYAVSHSFHKFSGWMVLDMGYTFREGAPADEIPVYGEFAYLLPLGTVAPHVKVSGALVKSVGNNSPAQPDDRFNFPPTSTYDFNDASMFRGSLSLLWLVQDGRWFAEVGYGQWLWGRGARKYKEPFLSVGRGF